MMQLHNAWAVLLGALWMTVWVPLASAAEASALEGIYRVGNLGLIRVASEKETVVGKYLGAGVCPFDRDQRVLQGQWEGQVFVGTVLLCQTTPECANRTYPIMAIFSEEASLWVADIQLAEGCESQALSTDKQLRLWPATPKEMEEVGAGFAAVKLPEARRSKPSRRVLEQHRRTLVEAQQMLDAGDYGGAAGQYELSLTQWPQSPQGHRGLGVAELYRGNILTALMHLEWAREGWTTPKNDVYEVDFQMAIALAHLQKREAVLARLRQAIRGGFRIPQEKVPEGLLALVAKTPELEGLTRVATEGKKPRRRR